MGFFSKTTTAVYRQASRDLRDAAMNLVGSDIAIEVAIEELEEKYDAANRKYSEVQSKYKTELGEYEAAKQTYEERLAKVQKIQAAIDGGNDNPALPTKREQLIAKLEETKPDVLREKDEADDAAEMVDDWKETVKILGEQLKNARATAKKVASQLDRAKMQEERAKDAEAQAKMRAGLSSGGTGSILENMERQAVEAQERADAARRKTALLKGTEDDVDDVDIDALIGGGEAAKPSTEDRLASLSL